MQAALTFSAIALAASAAICGFLTKAINAVIKRVVVQKTAKVGSTIIRVLLGVNDVCMPHGIGVAKRGNLLNGRFALCEVFTIGLFCGDKPLLRPLGILARDASHDP